MYENEIETQNRQKTENAERAKTNFPKEKVKNADFSKPVLNKIITTDEKCVKRNFVAPLTDVFLGSGSPSVVSFAGYKRNSSRY